jgi:hypothetical protein
MIIGSNEFVEGDSSGYEVDLSIKGIFLLTITLYFPIITIEILPNIFTMSSTSR